MKEAIFYLLAITLAEVLTTAIQPLLGIICHIIILLVVIVHSAIASEYRYRRLVLSLALVPLVRIISLSMPLPNIPQMWWYPLIYAPLLVAAVVAMRLLGYTGGDIGLNFRLLPVQLVVGLSGFLFGVAEYFILLPEPMVMELTWQQVWLHALVFLVCTGFVEEFIFRGVLQHTALEAFGWWGIVYISLLFAVLHLIHYADVGLIRVLIDIAFVFVVAMFFGWMVKKTGSLFGVSLSHGITNFVLYVVIPSLLG